MSRWSGAVGGKNWARKAWDAAVKEEQGEGDDMLAEDAICGLCVRFDVRVRVRVRGKQDDEFLQR